jgi:hypothetical protein
MTVGPGRGRARYGDDAGLVELTTGWTLELVELLATCDDRLVRVQTILECPAGLDRPCAT